MIEKLCERYAQLYLAPGTGVSRTELFHAITKEGMAYTGSLTHFTGSGEDRYAKAHTPAGDVELLSFGLREDFVTAVRILRDRCEMTEIPESVDAVTITGLTDWGKVRAHEKAYRATGCTDWDKECRRFLENRDGCTSPLILLCEGELRGLAPEDAGMPRAQWRKVSGAIRKNRELARFVCAKQYGGLANDGWDPILWDCIGIFAALRRYDDVLAKKLLSAPTDAALRAVDALQETVCCWGGTDPMKLIKFIYHETDLYETRL